MRFRIIAGIGGMAICFKIAINPFCARSQIRLWRNDTYLLELVRYIHLNPLRAKIVKSQTELDTYPHSGHSALMGKVPRGFQDTDYVLRLFGEKVPAARKAYRAYVEKGTAQGRRPELVGGGLIRSAGGWSAVKAMHRAKDHMKSDERILGDGEFTLMLHKQYGKE